MAPHFRGQKGSKRGQNEVFVHFLEFASLVFANFAYYDRWACCLATGTTKSPKLGSKSTISTDVAKSVGIRREVIIFSLKIIPPKKIFFFDFFSN